MCVCASTNTAQDSCGAQKCTLAKCTGYKKENKKVRDVNHFDRDGHQCSVN